MKAAVAERQQVARSPFHMKPHATCVFISHGSLYVKGRSLFMTLPVGSHLGPNLYLWEVNSVLSYQHLAGLSVGSTATQRCLRPANTPRLFLTVTSPIGYRHTAAPGGHLLLTQLAWQHWDAGHCFHAGDGGSWTITKQPHQETSGQDSNPQSHRLWKETSQLVTRKLAQYRVGSVAFSATSLCEPHWELPLC